MYPRCEQFECQKLDMKITINHCFVKKKKKCKEQKTSKLPNIILCCGCCRRCRCHCCFSSCSCCLFVFVIVVVLVVGCLFVVVVVAAVCCCCSCCSCSCCCFFFSFLPPTFLDAAYQAWEPNSASTFWGQPTNRPQLKVIIKTKLWPAEGNEDKVGTELSSTVFLFIIIIVILTLRWSRSSARPLVVKRGVHPYGPNIRNIQVVSKKIYIFVCNTTKKIKVV